MDEQVQKPRKLNFYDHFGIDFEREFPKKEDRCLRRYVITPVDMDEKMISTGKKLSSAAHEIVRFFNRKFTIRKHTFFCCISYTNIAKGIRRTKCTIINAMNELEKLGFIIRFKKRYGKNHLTTLFPYYFSDKFVKYYQLFYENVLNEHISKEDAEKVYQIWLKKVEDNVPDKEKS